METSEGWLYLAAVMDLFSRRIVGWSMSNKMTSAMVSDALMMAIWRRGNPAYLMYHLEQGSQYSSMGFLVATESFWYPMQVERALVLRQCGHGKLFLDKEDGASQRKSL